MADEQRNEQPTKKRLEKSRKDGRFPVSRDLVQAAQLLAFTFLTANWGAQWIDVAARATRHILTAGLSGDLSMNGFMTLLTRHLFGQLSPTLMAGFMLTGVALAVQLASTQLGVSISRLRPDFSRLNPVSRLTSLPAQNLAQAVKAIILLPLLILAVWFAVRQNLEGFLALPWLSVRPGVAEVGAALRRLLWYASTLLMISGIVDWTWQKRQLNKTLRMSKQEVRDEHKETEGNPQTKGRLRRLQRDMARRNMMKEVQKATAVIVNPTHFAVAIHYQLEAAAAPRVVAKGQDYLALRIRQRAIDHGVPIVENRPLAQALYKSVEVGQEIPQHLYRAVAEILAYIYRLMNGKLPG
ncbi:MAG TPA: EscU/YscU/HrcU family type III secretion system export apparatus switch protein [Bryobacteraceae bacterium]|jgi:flagellar biosynthetic protein FlhB